MTEQQKIYFWGYKMWGMHWVFSTTLFLMFIPLTVYALITMGQPQSTAQWIFIGWGFFAGLALQAWTPMIIKYRRKWIKQQH